MASKSSGARAPRFALTATCHCGAVRIHVRQAPRAVTSCNCSICRRYGALWAYYSPGSVRIEARKGALESYSWRRKVRAYFHCKTCGCVTHYTPRKRWLNSIVAVNASNFELEAMRGVRIRKLDGAKTWTFLS
jgi:hypothetical protein